MRHICLLKNAKRFSNKRQTIKKSRTQHAVVPGFFISVCKSYRLYQPVSSISSKYFLPHSTDSKLSNLHYARETHESHGQQTGSNEGDRRSLHAFGDVDKTHLLAQTSKESQGQTKAQGCREGVNNSCKQVVIFLDNEDGNTQNTTVGSNQRQEYTQCLIKCGRNLFQDDFNHLHKSSDDQNEGNGLQIAQIKDIEHKLLDKERNDGGNGKHKGYGSRHTQRCINLLGNAEERTDSQEL